MHYDSPKQLRERGRRNVVWRQVLSLVHGLWSGGGKRGEGVGGGGGIALVESLGLRLRVAW